MTNLSGNLWPIHPHRLPDELLSFWMLRSAHANRIKLQTFTNVTFGRTASPWARDIDRCASPAFLTTLSERTGSAVEELSAGMLSSYEGIVFEHHNPSGNTAWILPLGIYHRTRTAYGMQYCPACLFSDPIPYFRKRWRLAFATICDQHGTLLQDRCPQCSAPVIYFRNDLGHRKHGSLGNHTLCWRCGFDLRRAPAVGGDYLDAESYTALRSLLTFIDDGVGVAGDHYFQYPHLFLQGLHRVCEMLASSGTRRRYDKLKQVLSEETGLSLPESDGRGVFEHFSVYERHRVLLSALWLLMDWPERFSRICEKASLSRSYILGDLDLVPYWFDRVLKDRLYRPGYEATEEESRCVAAYLERHQLPVTRKAVQVVLGGRDRKAAAPYKKQVLSPWPETDEAFDLLLRAADMRIKSLKRGSSRQHLAERDRVIVLMMKHTQWPVPKVLDRTLSDIALLLEPSDTTLPAILKNSLSVYIGGARHALVGERTVPKLFVGTNGKGIGPENLAQKIRKLRDLTHG